jgi:carbon-monoxide dehydrogenase iron sulfur subunit
MSLLEYNYDICFRPLRIFTRIASDNPHNHFSEEVFLKRVYAIEENCIGCRLCEVRCVTQHSKSKDVVKAHRKEIPTPSRVKVQEQGAISFAVQCRHCEEPACVYSCLSGAMSRDPLTGIVTHDNERCIGCWTCVMVCPTGAVIPDVKTRKVAAKCDLCIGLEIPVCVQNCPNRALVYQEASP